MTILAWVLLFLLAASIVVGLHVGSKSAPRCTKCGGVMASKENPDTESVSVVVMHVVPPYQESKCEVCGYTKRWFP